MTPNTHSNILPLFEYLAEWTWDLLENARQLRLKISEDTITDMTAFEIARASLRGVKVARVTKQEEARYGFDWMWFIGNGVQGYEPYVIQAKKIRLGHGGKSSYNIRYKTGPVHQVAVLKSFAQTLGATPLYCFYNNVDPSIAIRDWHCPQWSDFRQMGCTLVPLDAVMKVHTPGVKKDFHAIHCDQRALPWRCLFHPRCVGKTLHKQAQLPLGYPPEERAGEVTTRAERMEHLPDFLLGDQVIVDISDVIDQLRLTGRINYVVGEPQTDYRLVVPKRFLVVESEYP